MPNEITAEELAREMCRMDGTNPDKLGTQVTTTGTNLHMVPNWWVYESVAANHLLATRAHAALMAERQTQHDWGDMSMGHRMTEKRVGVEKPPVFSDQRPGVSQLPMFDGLTVGPGHPGLGSQTSATGPLKWPSRKRCGVGIALNWRRWLLMRPLPTAGNMTEVLPSPPAGSPLTRRRETRNDHPLPEMRRRDGPRNCDEPDLYGPRSRRDRHHVGGRAGPDNRLLEMQIMRMECNKMTYTREDWEDLLNSVSDGHAAMIRQLLAKEDRLKKLQTAEFVLVAAKWNGALHCAYLNDYRIAGSKPYGGSTTMREWKVNGRDIFDALGIEVTK